MKKSIALFIVLVLSALLASAPASAQVKLGLKVTGGLGYYGAGDLNTGLQGWSDAYRKIYDTSTLTGGYSPVHWGPEFGGELLLQLNPSLALGLGVGYLQASRSSALGVSKSGTSFEESWSPKIGAVPVTLNLHYYLPLGGRVRLSLDAGLGYYFGTCTDSQHMVFIVAVDRTYDTTANGIGFHGGLGLEIPVSTAVSIVLEAHGRYASLGNFKGSFHSASTDKTGGVWLSDVFLDRTYSLIDISEEMPDSQYNPRAAKLDFSGFRFQAGFLFRFGSAR